MGIFARVEKRFYCVCIYNSKNLLIFGDDNQKYRLCTREIFFQCWRIEDNVSSDKKKKRSGYLHILGKTYKNYSVKKYIKYPKCIVRYITVMFVNKYRIYLFSSMILAI